MNEPGSLTLHVKEHLLLLESHGHCLMVVQQRIPSRRFRRPVKGLVEAPPVIPKRQNCLIAHRFGDVKGLPWHHLQESQDGLLPKLPFEVEEGEYRDGRYRRAAQRHIHCCSTHAC